MTAEEIDNMVMNGEFNLKNIGYGYQLIGQEEITLPGGLIK